MTERPTNPVAAPGPARAPAPSPTLSQAPGTAQVHTSAATPTRPRHPASPAPHRNTFVVEEGAFRSRLRRPRDLLGAVVSIVLAVLVVALAVTAQQTVNAIDDDLVDAQRSLPNFIWGMLSALAGLGVVMLPLVAAVSMLVRRRGRQLLESIAAMTSPPSSLTLDLLGGPRLRLRHAQRGTHRRADQRRPGVSDQPLLGGLIAFVTVARLMSRPRWNVISVVIVASTALVGSVSAGSTSTAQSLSCSSASGSG